MKKLFLSLFIISSTISNSYSQSSNSENMQNAVKRFIQFVDVNYYLMDEEGEGQPINYQLNKNVWYLGKGNDIGDGNKNSIDECYKNDDEFSTCFDLFAVKAGIDLNCGGNGCLIGGLFLTSPKRIGISGGQIDLTSLEEIELFSKPQSDYEIKQTKKAPYPEFSITYYEHDDGDGNHFPSKKYQQNFRFNNHTLKLEPLGKAKFLGKE